MSRLVISIAIMALVVSGCSTKYHGMNADRQADLFIHFYRGEAVLDCRTSCAGAWGQSRRAAKRTYEAGRWRDLALWIMYTGFDGDLNWFYLGRAAEGLNAPRAAKTYYARALSGSEPCDGPLINHCDGFVVPRDAQARIDLLAQHPATQPTNDLPPSPKPNAALRPSPNANDPNS